MDTLSLYSHLSQQTPGSVVFTSSYLTPLPLDRHSVIADIGCGLGGRATWVTRSRCCETHLFDRDTSKLDHAFARAEEGGAEQQIKLHHVQAEDYGSLDAAPKSFDLIIAEGVAFELDPFEYAENWRSLVKPGGSIAIVAPGLTRPQVADEVKSFINERSSLELGTLDQYHERIAGMPGVTLFHQVTLAQYSWDEYYQNLGRRLKGALKSGEFSSEHPSFMAAQRELQWYRQVARGQLFLQAFVLTVSSTGEG